MGEYELEDDRDLDDLEGGDGEPPGDSRTDDAEPWAKFSTGRDPGD